jgi:hypothetical protein
VSNVAPNYDEIDRLEIERLIVDDLGCGSPQDARFKLDLIVRKLAAVTAERDALLGLLQESLVKFNAQPRPPVNLTKRIKAAIDAAKAKEVRGE